MHFDEGKLWWWSLDPDRDELFYVGAKKIYIMAEKGGGFLTPTGHISPKVAGLRGPRDGKGRFRLHVVIPRRSTENPYARAGRVNAFIQFFKPLSPGMDTPFKLISFEYVVGEV